MVNKDRSILFRLRAHMDELLDEALQETFPASDAVGIDVASPRFRSDRQQSRTPQGEYESNI